MRRKIKTTTACAEKTGRDKNNNNNNNCPTGWKAEKNFMHDWNTRRGNVAHRQTNGAHRPVLQLCSCAPLPLSPPACLSIQALRLLFYLLHSFRRQSVCVGNDKKAHHDSTGPGAKLVPTRPCVAPLFSAFSLALPLLSSTRCTVYPAVVATKRY